MYLIIGACSDIGAVTADRLQISDGESYQPCMVATQLNNKIANGEIEQYAIICLDKYVCNIIQGRK